jgi:hypothetical protein
LKNGAYPLRTFRDDGIDKSHRDDGKWAGYEHKYDLVPLQTKPEEFWVLYNYNGNRLAQFSNEQEVKDFVQKGETIKHFREVTD